MLTIWECHNTEDKGDATLWACYEEQAGWSQHARKVATGDVVRVTRGDNTTSTAWATLQPQSCVGEHYMCDGC